MNRQIGYTERVWNFIKSHPLDSFVLGIFNVILVILAISYTGFVPLVQAILSPQVVICSLILYIVISFRPETSRLIDRIREITGPFGIKTDPVAATPRDIKNIPQPEVKIPESVTIVDPETKLTVKDIVEMTRPYKEELAKTYEKATYWFYRYLSTELSPKHLWVLRRLSEEPEGVQTVHLYLEMNSVFKRNEPNSTQVLRSLMEFELIKEGGNSLVLTETGNRLIKFYEEIYKDALKREAQNMLRKDSEPL